MSFEIKPATRTGVKPLVGFYGKSGSGKTMSALLLARGLAGAKGRVVMVDTENGRGSIFADLIPGGYSVLNLDAPFTADRYQEAIATAEKSADVVLVDSMSHEWSGEGGVLDQANENEEKSGKPGLHNWNKPKIAHKLMVQRLLRCAVPLICCLRGEEKTHQGKDEKGKTIVFTDDFSSPLFDPRFIFEMLINFETISRNGVGGYVIPRKITHPSVAALLPGENEQISIKTGEALAKWCQAPGAAPANKPPKDENAALKIELWKITEPKHGNDKAKFKQWLIDEMIIAPEETFEHFTAANWQAAIVAARKKVAA